MKKRIRFSIACILSLLLGLQMPLTTFADGVGPESAPDPSPAIAQFTDTVVQFLRDAHLMGGAASVNDATGIVADNNPQFGALVELVRRENNGKPVVIEIHGPASMQNAVDFSNEQLKSVFGSAFVYRLAVNNDLPGVDAVFKDEQKSYGMWKRARMGTMPMLGFAAAIATFFLQGEQPAAEVVNGILANPTLDNATVRNLMPSLAIGAATAGLESQFILLTKKWNLLWRQSQDSFSFSTGQDAESIPEPVRGKLVKVARILDKIKNAANWSLDRTVNPVMRAARISRSQVYNYLVNFGYAATLYTAGFLTGNSLGLTNEHFSLLTAFQNAFWGNNLFFITMGMFQIGLGKMNDMNLLSEALRFKLESTASFINGAGRILSFLPGMQAAGYAVQSMFLLSVTIPTWAYLLSITKNSERTGTQLNDPNIHQLADELEMDLQRQARALENCEALMAGAIPKPVFGHSTVSEMAGNISSRLRDSVRRLIGG